MAIAAVGAAMLYYLVSALLAVALAASVGGASTGLKFGLASVWMVFGGASTGAIFAPVAFVAGITAWRLIPASQRYAGALGGLLATVLVYLVPGVILTGGAAVFAAVTGGAAVSAVFSMTMAVGFAFGMTCWITLPVGTVSGALYERSRSQDG